MKAVLVRRLSRLIAATPSAESARTSRCEIACSRGANQQWVCAIKRKGGNCRRSSSTALAADCVASMNRRALDMIRASCAVTDATVSDSIAPPGGCDATPSFRLSTSGMSIALMLVKPHAYSITVRNTKILMALATCP